MTQHNKILNALKLAGDKGINSFSARSELQVIQLPTRVWELKRLGHQIIEKVNPDKSVNYILTSSPAIKQEKDYTNFVFTKDGHFYLKEEPKQMSF